MKHVKSVYLTNETLLYNKILCWHWQRVCGLISLSPQRDINCKTKNWLTSCSRAVLERLTFPQLDQKNLVFYGNLSFITLTTVPQLSYCRPYHVSQLQIYKDSFLRHVIFTPTRTVTN